MPVGGSRHYDPGGAGSEGIWACPSCGEDNSGPLSQGCVVCGAGKPGHKVEPGAPPGPPPSPLTGRKDDPPPVTPGMQWMHMHPGASVAEAFDAGFLAGINAARHSVVEHARRHTPAPADRGAINPEFRMTRTLIAALTLFRDQVLVEAGEEILSGEWAGILEVNAVILRLQGELQGKEVGRA